MTAMTRGTDSLGAGEAALKKLMEVRGVRKREEGDAGPEKKGRATARITRK